MSVHKSVFEYDGAFRCCDCGHAWGALPNNPTEPIVCNKDKLIAEKKKQIIEVEGLLEKYLAELRYLEYQNKGDTQ